MEKEGAFTLSRAPSFPVLICPATDPFRGHHGPCKSI
jgi:hypothetical protein